MPAASWQSQTEVTSVAGLAVVWLPGGRGRAETRLEQVFPAVNPLKMRRSGWDFSVSKPQASLAEAAAPALSADDLHEQRRGLTGIATG